MPAAVLLALSLGLYQTNLACFCLVLLAYFLLLLFQNGEKQKIREYICKSLASAASGAVLYLLILKITLWATERRWPITRVVQIFQCLEF